MKEQMFNDLVKDLEKFIASQKLLSENAIETAKSYKKDLHTSQYYLRSSQIYDETYKTILNIVDKYKTE